MAVESPPHILRRSRDRAFTEASVWRSAGADWRQLAGAFHDSGYSIEWHDFVAGREFDWSQSFHPDGLEICLNLAGHAEVHAEQDTLELGARTAGFYAQSGARLKAIRHGGERHQFATIEFSLPFLQKHGLARSEGSHPLLTELLTGAGGRGAHVSEAIRMTSEQRQVALSLQRPPVYAAAQRVWYHAKALELAAAFLFQPARGEEMFCQRVKRLNRERVQKVRAVLSENLAEPLSLEELGRRVGCSRFHLSRIFTEEMGQTITACLRELRLERAAELLRTGLCNVTEAAFAVGYNSLSHFTVAFRETFGCCPGLYPLKIPAQKPQGRSQYRNDAVTNHR